MLKAKAICELAKLPAIADDSGLCVDALNGGPGVYSARYGGEGLDDKGRYMLLLQTMRGRPPVRLILPAPLPVPSQWGHHHRRGAGPGTIAFAPMGRAVSAMTLYSSCLTRQRPLAQLTREEKAEISPPGKALREFTAKLETYLKK